MICYRMHRRQSVLDAVVQLLKDNSLQLFRDVLLRGVDSRLFEKLPKIGVLQLQPDFVFASLCRVLKPSRE